MGYKPKRVKTPLYPKDHPELDESPLVEEKTKKIYWSLMGMLQWAVTIGRMDIHVAVMTMGRFRMEPRQGHLERVARIFGFLRYYKSSSIKFCIDKPDYSIYKPLKSDWKYVYGELKEELPKNMLEPKGKEVIISGFCDANLNHDLTTGCAVMSNIIMLNKTPTDWMSKRQATVETATYG